MSTSTQHQAISVSAGPVVLEGDLAIPAGAQAVVLFAHGSGSSRHSSRNRFVAEALHRAGLATLLIDLLTAEEEEAERYSRHLRFDIPLLAERLSHAARWLTACGAGFSLRGCDGRIGLFGASTGAAAALVTAAELPDFIGAVVSRGGRPDLAGDALARVRAPTLFLVGSLDYACIPLNEEAFAQLQCPKELVIVPGATHLFEEPGTLDEVARLASEWFARHLAQA